MNTTRKFFILSLLVIISCQWSSAQEWMNEPYLDRTKENITFYDIQQAFNTWAEGKDLATLKGVKQYKRWEWFYEPRVYPTGMMPDRRIVWEESLKYRPDIKSLRGNSNWVNLSPSTIPTPPDTLNIIGMGRINSITFHPTDINTLYIGSSSGGVWKSTDDGSTWTCLTDMIPVLRVSDVAVHPSNDNIMYIATGDINTISLGSESNEGIGILKTTNGGASWDTTGLSFNLTDGNSSLIRRIIINFQNHDELLAAGYDGVYKSYDAGVTWTQINDYRVIDVEVNPLDSNTIYISTYYDPVYPTSPRIYKTYDFGDSWSGLTTGIVSGSTVQRLELAISPSDTNYVYGISCAVNNGLYAIHKTTDAGATWSIVAALDTTGHPGAVEIPNLLGWADGGASGFMPDDGGQGTYDLTLIVDPNNPNKVYSGGVNMWGTDDGGVSWDILSMWIAMFGKSVHADQHFSVVHPVTGRFYQAHDGGIDKADALFIGNMNYVYTNCINWVAVWAGDFDNAILAGCYELPTQWTNITHGLHITEYYRLGCCKTNSGKIVAGSQDNGTYLYDNGTWHHTLGGDGMEAMIDHYNDSIIYATNYNGSLSKSYDGGVTYISGLDSVMSATESGAWVTPYIMHPQNSDVLYAGFQNVWKSNDGGMNWTKISSITGATPLSYVAFAPSDPDSTIYCGKGAVLYRTNNGGTSWINLTYSLPATSAAITSIAVDYSNPDKIWITYSGYVGDKKVYVSTNAGSSWTNISDGLPNVPVNCIVHQPNSGFDGSVYVGTDIGVFYTNDSLLGTSTKWISFNTNLPDVVVSELEISYDIQKIRAATYGRGLWESPLYSPSDFSYVSEPEREYLSVRVFPNPGDGIFNISFNTTEKEVVKIAVYASNGDKIMEIYDKSYGVYIKSVNLGKYPDGAYILQVNLDESQYTTRLIKE